MESTPQHYLVTPLAYTGAAIAFTYHAEAVLPIGQIVAIPLGRRRSLGVVTATTNRPTFATKPALPLDLPPLPTYLISLAEWLASYYAASPAAVWSALLPAGLAKTRRIIKTPASTQPAHGLPAHPLTDEQAAVLSAIGASEQSVHLIQGVTGSGKTRLYLELAAEALATGHSVIVLVPEITLTPQVVGQFEQAFGPLVLTTHSKLTESQRDHIWRAAMSATAAGEQRVIVGPRSSLFLPLHQLGLIIVDESHENSYKQEQHPRYHVIPTAAQLSRLTGARVVLGSATPSLGELFLASEGKISRHVLTKRVHDKPLPQATIIDLRDKSQLKTSKFIAQPLIDAVTATLEAGRQSVLYLNRRGSASSQVCADCGHVTTCPHCQLPLTFHADLMRLVCHHCNYRQALPAVCPNCAGADLR
ncbi:MAG TPA: primosomal protein N', partial [Candidatus Saccharimonas sp.]|nr:primosomal protein N' [Candidatus Saccharimonas sp.]